MSVFSVLDVAIGMIFFYLLLSLICSAINELLSAFLNTRGGLLKEGIVRLVDSADFTEMLYSHPLIRNLSTDVNPLTARLVKNHLPPYIPSRDFALALMDTINPGYGTKNALTSGSTTLSPTTVVNINQESVTTTAPDRTAPVSAPPLLQALLREDASTPPTVKRAVVALIEAGGQDATKARQYIEDWYNSTMDRVAGIYKRRTQYILFCIGAATTIAINADSIVVVKRLATNKQLSTIMANSAQQFMNSSSRISSASDQMNTRALLAEVKTPKPKGIAEQARSLAETMDTLDKIGMPIGWDGPGYANTFPTWNASFWTTWWALFHIHWIGWLVTALAISFGASFWFDLLNRFMVVRSTVKPHEKSAEEQSKG